MLLSRYNKMMVMVDTCQANTLYSSIYSPNVLATGSSELGENSYSHHNDMEIGVAVIDSFTHYVLQYLEGIQRGSNATMQDFVSSARRRVIL
jgi:phosphatidylinositol glycan class K